MHSRRKFLATAGLLGAGTVLIPGCGMTQKSTSTGSVADKFVVNPYEVAVVRDYVYYAHSDFEQLKTYTEKYPHLINATVDWGDGDFESAIGATGHMGNREFAQFLLDKGARADLFVLTMLGKTDLVMAWLNEFPQLLNAIGPHGFTLLHHAEVGGKQAEDLHAYLLKAGLKEKFVNTFVKEEQ